MSLPNLSEDVSYTKVDLPCGKKINIKPWKVKEERELMFAIDGQEDTTEVRKEIVKMARKCVDNVTVFDTLSKTNITYLIGQLRKHSKGSKIEYGYRCTNLKCKLPLSDDVNVDTDIKVTPFKGGVKKINDLLTFSTKEVSFYDEEKLKETFTKYTEYNYNYILKSIDSFSFKGEVYTEFTDVELAAALDTMNPTDFDVLSEFVLSSVSNITIEKTLVCKKCKTTMEIPFGDLNSFFAF